MLPYGNINLSYHTNILYIEIYLTQKASNLLKMRFTPCQKKFKKITLNFRNNVKISFFFIIFATKKGQLQIPKRISFGYYAWFCT
jgi:uncharacterized membrane protein